MPDRSYVLVTPAKNEEGYIRQVMESVVAQNHVPKAWLIVSDGSTDKTDELVEEFTRQHEFIRFLRLHNQGARAFSSQAFALNAGYETVKQIDCDFIGFLDADVSFNADYYAKLIEKFEANPRLGVAGGEIYERKSGRFEPRFGNSDVWVSGAVQFFKRECFDRLGGFTPLAYGGHDFVANANALSRGWETQSFSDLPVFHHRATGSADATLWRSKLREGMAEYFMGYQMLFEMAKCVRRVTERPFVVASVLRFCGYALPWCARQKRGIPEDLLRYVRQEQRRRMFRSVFGHRLGWLVE